MTPAERVRILVVGGGVGGLACALGLARVGRRVRVLEAAPEFSEIGAGIQLAPNATRALDELGVLQPMLHQAVFPQELVYMDARTGERITSVDLGGPFVERYGHPYVVMHRTDLHSALLDACIADPGVTLETNKAVEEVEDLGDSARARCADGTSYEADCLIGADGLHSVVRRLMSDDEPVASEYVAYRGAIPFAEVSPHAGEDSMVMWVGPDLHLVQYKLRGGELYNQVGVFKSARYGEPDWGAPEELDQHFGRCCEMVSYGASLLRRDMRWPMYDRDPIDNWTRNRITLLGDAAHPMLQYLAQGGCQAIEDAVCLAKNVDGHDDYETAFQAYQAERIPRTARVQHSARRFGDICHIHGVGIDLRNAFFATKAPQDYEPLDWLYIPVNGGPPAATPESQTHAGRGVA
ncbi:MAG: 3-hydroxybenzoate 6-monooxygenase [Thermoleophilaceae bacterium]|nr:3-hydroxybenzoate 6-monooxygenase [Thermoleophilaceae bacterium]